jgi:hypothetical protein
MQNYVRDVQDLLTKAQDASVGYVDLLDLLIKLERQHSKLITKIQLGVREDMSSLTESMETVWKIGEIASRLRLTVEKKLKE